MAARVCVLKLPCCEVNRSWSSMNWLQLKFTGRLNYYATKSQRTMRRYTKLDVKYDTDNWFYYKKAYSY